MSRLWLHGGILADPEVATPSPGSLLVEEGRIAAVLRPDTLPPPSALPIALAGALLAPGFVDIHYHGALPGIEPDDAARLLRASSASLLRHGVTAFLATTVAWPAPELASRCSRIAEAIASGDWVGARPVGIHLEGPWINARAAGAQPPNGIRAYDPSEGAELFDRIDSLLRLVTLAPELPGARRLERDLARRGVAIALGHTLADADATQASIAEGASHVTHLFNAMGSNAHRAPCSSEARADGFAGLALETAALGCDLIADGAHVHPDWLRRAAAAKAGRAILISDRIDVEPGAAGWLGADRMRIDGVAWRLPDGRLAGSRLTLDRAVRNAVEMRVMNLHDAIRACTLLPARLVGIEREHGTLRVGARADLLALDANGAVLRTWIGGREV